MRVKECLHPWVKVDQAVRPLPPKSLNILVGLTLKLSSLCITVSVVENIWTLWFVFSIFWVASLKRFVLLLISRNVKILWEILPKLLRITWVALVSDEVCLDQT